MPSRFHSPLGLSSSIKFCRWQNAALNNGRQRLTQRIWSFEDTRPRSAGVTVWGLQWIDECQLVTLLAHVERSGLHVYFFNNPSVLTADYSQPPGFWPPPSVTGREAGRHPGQPSYWLKTLKGCGKASGKINVSMYSVRSEPVIYSMWRTTVLLSGFNGTHTVNLSKFLSVLNSRWWMVTDGVHHVNVDCSDLARLLVSLKNEKKLETQIVVNLGNAALTCCLRLH